MVIMKSWCLLALVTSLADATQLKRVTQVPTSNSAGTAYKTDLFQGLNQAIQDSTLNNSELTYTRRNGKPYFQPLGAQRAGKNGPLLLQDVHLLDTLAAFNRERIPERVVHARGAGAHGFFEATTDFAANLSAAEFFRKGTRTSVTVRFSTVGGARGSADQARDPRGVAIKFRTSQGILDWVFNNTPVFFLRDPAKVLSCPLTLITKLTRKNSSRDSSTHKRPIPQPTHATGTHSGPGPLNSPKLCCSFSACFPISVLRMVSATWTHGPDTHIVW
jgi:catalase